MQRRASVTATWAWLPRGAVEDLVGYTQDGAPLSDLLGELPGEAGNAVKTALIVGVATGQDPRTVARMIRQELGGNIVRALTISRTEILRSYRSASLRGYQANVDILEGWVWHAAWGRRTCAFCWSRHGSLHKLDEVMATHPRCRCTMAPRTVGWEAILGEKGKGIPDTRPKIERGTDLFEQLSDERKRNILGPAKFAAYQDGAIKLQDVAGFRHDPKWGPVGYERSLADILGADEAKKWKAAVVDRTAISERMKKQWQQVHDARDVRTRQLGSMGDKQFVAEVRGHQSAEWQQTKLLEHVKKHQALYSDFAGHPVGPKELDEISKSVLGSWDRMFTSVDPGNVAFYTFLANWSEGQVLLTVTRDGRIRTLIPTKNLAGYRGRHPELVEVTDRARRLGI